MAATGGQGPAFRIGDRTVGHEHPPYVIAEAGVHHANDVAVGRRLIESAARAGADAIKFQTYSAEHLATRWAPTYWASPPGLTQFDLFSTRSRLDEAAYRELAACARESGITFLSTPFDPGAVDLLLSLDVPAFKVASADLTHVPLLEAVAATGRPVLASTGAATFEEVREALDVLGARGAPVALLHCVLSYPTPLEDANLGRIASLRERFPEAVIGYSDHTRSGDSLLPCALAVDPEGLATLVRDCRLAAVMTRRPTERRACEEPARRYARRSIVAARDLAADTVLTPADVECKRPGTGMPPSQLRRILGRRLRRDVPADALILEHDLD